MCKKNVRIKTIRGKTFINIWITKLNYFGKKVGPAFWHYNVIRIWAMYSPFSRFLVIFFPLSPRTPFKNVCHHTFISVNNRGRATSKYVNKLAIGFYFFIPEVKQDSTPQNDSTLGFKWIKKIAQNIV